MSTLRLRTGARTLSVALAPDADGVVASVDGDTHRLAVAPTFVAGVAGATVESLDVTIDGVARRAVVARTRDRIHVALAGQVWVFERVDDAERGGAGGAGSGTVVAPMPGKVVAVRVAVGDAVTVGQPLVVIEAMKMETTLVAEIDGTVRAVNATPGAMADAGAVLVEIA